MANEKDAKSLDEGYDVSYRQRWWLRRMWACGNVSEDEALRQVQWMLRNGYRGVRLEVTRRGN